MLSELRDSAWRQIRQSPDLLLDSTVRAFTIELRRRLKRFARNDIHKVAFGMREFANNAVRGAGQQADLVAVANARGEQSLIYECTEAFLAFADPGGTSKPTKADNRALTGLAEQLTAVLSIVDSVFGPVRSDRLAGWALDRSSLRLEVEQHGGDFDSARYEELLAEDWMWPTATADYGTIRAALAYASGELDLLPDDFGDFDRMHKRVTGCSFGDFLRVVRALSKHDLPATGVRRSADFPFAEEVAARSGVEVVAARTTIGRLTLPAVELSDAYTHPRSFASRAATTRWRPMCFSQTDRSSMDRRRSGIHFRSAT